MLFAAGELDGIVIPAIGEADIVQQGAGASRGAACGTGEFGGEENVFFGCEGWDELIGLEYEAEFASPEEGERIFVQAGNFFAVELNGAAGDGVETGEETEQGALAGTGRAHDGNELALRNVEINTAENVDGVRGGGDGFVEFADADGRPGVGVCHRMERGEETTFQFDAFRGRLRYKD